MTAAPSVKLTEFVQEPYASTAEFQTVQRIARELHQALETAEVQMRLSTANLPGKTSAHVQAAFVELATRLGFRNEASNLFRDYKTRALRPDYFLQLNGTGILLEVERGKTTINNMDMLDFWKCHLCTYANYLFLLVPNALVQHEGMRPRNEYLTVCNRLSAFFIARNYTNVRGLHVFGY